MNLPVGVNAAYAGVLDAELLPGKSKLLVLTAIPDLLQALGVRGGAPVGDQAKRLMAPEPRAEIQHRFRIIVILVVAHIVRTVHHVRFSLPLLLKIKGMQRENRTSCPVDAPHPSF